MFPYGFKYCPERPLIADKADVSQVVTLWR